MKKKIPLPLRIITWAFPKVEKLAPRVAANWAWKLFFTPFRFNPPKVEVDFGNTANQFELRLGDKKIAGYEWGTGERAILVMHGWSGRATQFRKLIEKFNERDFRVIAIDGPAHGNSSGKSTHIFEFVELIKEVKVRFPEIEAIVAHSFGGPVSLMAIREGLDIKKIVNIGAPTDGDYVIADFIRRINGSKKSGDLFQQKVVDMFNMSFSDVSIKESLKHIRDLDLLMIHDELDKEVPVQHAIDLQANYPLIKLIITNGLGHMRILKSDVVIDHCLNFIMKEEKVLI